MTGWLDNGCEAALPGKRNAFCTEYPAIGSFAALSSNPCIMAFPDCPDKQGQLLSKQFQPPVDIFVLLFVPERSNFKKRFEVVDGFVVRRQGKEKKADEIQFILPPAVTFHNVCLDRDR